MTEQQEGLNLGVLQIKPKTMGMSVYKHVLEYMSRKETFSTEDAFPLLYLQNEDKNNSAANFYITALELLNNAIQEIHCQQAKIDSLMLEYCPNEMTDKQKENWVKHQVVSDYQIDPDSINQVVRTE